MAEEGDDVSSPLVFKLSEVGGTVLILSSPVPFTLAEGWLLRTLVRAALAGQGVATLTYAQLKTYFPEVSATSLSWLIDALSTKYHKLVLIATQPNGNFSAQPLIYVTKIDLDTAEGAYDTHPAPIWRSEFHKDVCKLLKGLDISGLTLEPLSLEPVGVNPEPSGNE